MKNLARLITPLLLIPAALPAAVLLNQPLAFVDGRSSTVAGPTTGFKTYERFTLAQSANINRITFIGAFADFTNTANNPVNPSGDNWNFEVTADNAGNPGSVTDSDSLAFASVQQTLLGNSTLSGQPVRVYSFTADLANPLFVAGGQTAWLSIFSTAANLDPRFAWLSGSGGDGVSKQLFLSNGAFTAYTDRAVTLEGEFVPEPGTFVLLGAGALLLGIYRRGTSTQIFSYFNRR